MLMLWALHMPGAQENSQRADPLGFVGMTLEELIGRFGMPQSVHPSRGIEEWQDDVVFVYEEGDFYIFRNRVWKAGLKAAMGINAGDSLAVVSLILGDRAQARFNSMFYSLDEGSWPMMLRCDFDADNRVLTIFIYRTDL